MPYYSSKYNKIKKYMTFWKYSKFLFSILSRKWSVYITTGLFILMMTLFLYVFPIVFNLNLINMFSMKGVLEMIMIFGTIAAATLGIQIFRTGIEDGTDLLISTKPITKATMVWSKVFVFIVSILIISLVNLFISIWCKFSKWNEVNAQSGIMLGYFVGTFTNFLIWGSIAILISAYRKKFIALTITIFVNIALLAISVVYSMILTGPECEMREKQNLSMTPICLVSEPNKNGESQYQWETILCQQKQKDIYPITNESIINGATAEAQGLNLGTYLSSRLNYWNHHSNLNTMTKLDFNYQLVSLFSIFSPKQFLKTGLSTIIRNLQLEPQGNTTYWTIKVVKNNDYSELIDSDNSFKPIGFDLDTSKENQQKFVLVNSANIEISNPNIDGNVYTGTGNYFSKSNFLDYSGTENFKWSDTNPTKFPIFSYNEKIGNWDTKTFNNPMEFVNYFYSSEMIKHNNEFMNYLFNNRVLSQDVKKHLSLNSLYKSIIASYCDANEKIDLAKNNYHNNDNFATKFNELFTKFQYWTYLGMVDAFNNPSEYSQFNKESLRTMLSVLNLPIEDFKEGRFGYGDQTILFVGTPMQMLYTMGVIKDLPSAIKVYNDNNQKNKIDEVEFVKNSSSHNYWFISSSSMSLIPENYLQTACTINLTSRYDINAMICCWVFAGLIFLMVGANIFVRKDVV